MFVDVQMLTGKFRGQMTTARTYSEHKQKTFFTQSADVQLMHMQVPFVRVAPFSALLLFDHESPTCRSLHLKRSFEFLVPYLLPFLDLGREA